MTVCIAALYGDGAGVVLVTDRMVTAHIPIGYEFEHQENTKIVELAGANSTHALIAGDVLGGNEILKVAQVQMTQRDGSVSASEAAEIVRGAYQQVRLEKITHQELGSRGLDIDTYYGRHQQLSQPIVQMIDHAFCKGNFGVEMLVAGPNGGTHAIHTILNPGTIHDNSSIGHGAIGSGAPHALYSLIEDSYAASLSKKEVVTLVKKAKKRSEVAPGVGVETTIVVTPREETNHAQ